jgi:Ca2+-binding EF-hand superfamily protein
MTAEEVGLVLAEADIDAEGFIDYYKFSKKLVGMI